MQVQLLVGTAPLKFGKAKNFQKSVRFTTTFESYANADISRMNRDIDKQ